MCNVLSILLTSDDHHVTTNVASNKLQCNTPMPLEKIPQLSMAVQYVKHYQ